MGIQNFTRYGLLTDQGEFVFFLVSPINISVLSSVNIGLKIRHLMTVLSAYPELEIVCTDSCECFDDNQSYLRGRLDVERDPKIRSLLKKDMEMDKLQSLFIALSPISYSMAEIISTHKVDGNMVTARLQSPDLIHYQSANILCPPENFRMASQIPYRNLNPFNTQNNMILGYFLVVYSDFNVFKGRKPNTAVAQIVKAKTKTCNHAANGMVP